MRLLKNYNVMYLGFFFSVILQLVSPEEVTLTGSISNGTTVHPGEVVNITCVIRDSEILIWLSDDYILHNGYLEFIPSNLGQQVTQSGGNITARLSRVNQTSDRNTTMVSILCIRVSLHPTYSVTCRNGGHFIDKTFTFYVVGKLHERVQ